MQIQHEVIRRDFERDAGPTMREVVAEVIALAPRRVAMYRTPKGVMFFLWMDA